MQIKETITVNRSLEDVFAFWTNYEELPRFMLDLESVIVTAPRQLRLKTKPDDGESVKWFAEITIETPNSQISWTTVRDEKVVSSGTVRFRPATGGRGTVVSVELDYDLPTTAAIKAAIAKFFGEAPADKVKKTLRASKQILETGGIVISEANIAPKHPAQPPAESELPLIERTYGPGAIGERI